VTLKPLVQSKSLATFPTQRASAPLHVCSGEKIRQNLLKEYRIRDLRNSRAVARKPRSGKIVQERRKSGYAEAGP
jgi:hypothetical protein